MPKETDPLAHFFTLKVPLYKVLLVAIGFCLVSGLFIWLQWNPLMRELGYAKEPLAPQAGNTQPSDTPAATPTPEALRQSINRDIDLTVLFSGITVGQDKNTLMELAASAPSNCATFQVPAFGAEELCIWINGDQAVIFTLFNNKVIAKSKIGF